MEARHEESYGLDYFTLCCKFGLFSLFYEMRLITKKKSQNDFWHHYYKINENLEKFAHMQIKTVVNFLFCHYKIVYFDNGFLHTSFGIGTLFLI